jgi:hypothetical protein
MELLHAGHAGEIQYMAIVAQVDKKIQLVLMGIAITENALVCIEVLLKGISSDPV